MFDRLRGFLSDFWELRRTRTQVALTEARVRQQQLALAESTRTAVSYAYGDLVSTRDTYWDDVEGGYPFGQHDRRHGENAPFIRSESDLAEVRGLARWIAEENPLAIGALENFTSFAVGDGLTYHATTKDTSAKEVADAVQEVVDEFLDLNEWNELEQELVRRSRRDGEYLVRYFPDEDGTTTVRTAEPDELTEQGAPTYWMDDAGREHALHPGQRSFGIRHLVEVDRESGQRHEDVQTALGYFLKYGPEDHGREVSPQYVQHTKVNVDRAVKRGMSDFYATRTTLELCRKLLRNMGEGDAVRAAIAGFWEYDGTSSTQASTHVGGIKDTGRTTTTNAITGKTPNYQKIEPGTFIHTPKQKKFVPPPASTAIASNVQTIQALLRAVGARWCMPEYMVSGDASNANFASTLVSGAPFIRFMKRIQRFYKQAFLKTLWAAVRFAFAAGRFDRFGLTYQQLKKLVTIQAEAPKPEIVNEMEDANRYQIERLNGVLSVQTWQQYRGLDPQQELANQKAYLEETGGNSLVTPQPKDFPGPEFNIEPGADPVAIPPAKPLERGPEEFGLPAPPEQPPGGPGQKAKEGREVSEGSYFADCQRDDKGHCTAGAGGGAADKSDSDKGGPAKGQPADAGQHDTSKGKATDAGKGAAAHDQPAGDKAEDKAPEKAPEKPAAEPAPAPPEKPAASAPSKLAAAKEKAKAALQAAGAKGKEVAAKAAGAAVESLKSTAAEYAAQATTGAWKATLAAAAGTATQHLISMHASLLSPDAGPVKMAAHAATWVAAKVLVALRGRKTTESLMREQAEDGQAVDRAAVLALARKLLADIHTATEGGFDLPSDEALLASLTDDPDAGDWLDGLERVDSAQAGADAVADLLGGTEAEEAAAGVAECCDEPAAPILLPVPDEAQDTAYSCGAACTTALARFFSVAELDTEQEAILALGTSPADGTAPGRIADVLARLGLRTTAGARMTLDELRGFVAAGRPVVVALQAWGEPQNYPADLEGHYAVVVGWAPGHFVLMDPARFAEGEEVAEYGGPDLGAGQRVAVPDQHLLEVWHDVGAAGERYERYGIAVWRPEGEAAETPLSKVSANP